MTKVTVLEQEKLVGRSEDDEDLPEKNLSQLEIKDNSLQDFGDSENTHLTSHLDVMTYYCAQKPYIPKMQNKSNKRLPKPYEELPAREKERIARKAMNIHGEMLGYGLNLSVSTIEHILAEDNILLSDRPHSVYGPSEKNCNRDSSEEFSSSGEDNQESTELNLDDDYKAMYMDYLNYQSNRALVEEYVDLENRVQEVENSLKHVRLENQFRTRDFDVQAELEKIRVFQEEIGKLTKENDSLESENEQLRLKIPSSMV